MIAPLRPFQIKSCSEAHCLYLSLFWPDQAECDMDTDKGTVRHQNCFFLWKKSAGALTFLTGDDRSDGLTAIEETRTLFFSLNSLADIARALNESRTKMHYCLVSADPESIYAVDEEELAEIVPRRLQRNIQADRRESSHYALVRLLSMGHSPALVARQGNFILPFHAGLPAGVLEGVRPEIQNHELEEDDILILHSQPAKEGAGQSLRELHEALARCSIIKMEELQLPSLLVATLGFRETII
jgi:predicted transcriptional regulator